MKHESQPYTQPGGDVASPLEAASSFLGGTAAARRTSPADERRICQGRQQRDLKIWAQQSGCWLKPDMLAPFERGGEEHRIRRGEERYWKATYPGQSGFTIIATDCGPTFTRSLPQEYLKRLVLSNHLFGDDIRLEGITEEEGQVVIVTSQPTIAGVPPSSDEMVDFFTVRYFELIPGFHAGYRGSFSFYRELDQMAVFDVHPANVPRDRSGLILPIDVVVVQADAELAFQLEAMLE
jgi:hypothetical protein